MLWLVARDGFEEVWSGPVTAARRPFLDSVYHLLTTIGCPILNGNSFSIHSLATACGQTGTATHLSQRAFAAQASEAKCSGTYNWRRAVKCAM